MAQLVSSGGFRGIRARSPAEGGRTSLARSRSYTDRAMAHMRTSVLGPAARPVAVPEDLDDPSLPKAGGKIEHGRAPASGCRGEEATPLRFPR